jgi:hypothetical protein
MTNNAFVDIKLCGYFFKYVNNGKNFQKIYFKIDLLFLKQ